MRLTVGPLAPAVYWRRRALVLGGFLVAVLLLTYTCSGESGAKDGKDRTAGTKRSSAPASPSPLPSASLLTPTIGDPVPPPSSASQSTVPVAPGGGGGAANSPCADSEITVVPAAEAPSVRQGVPAKLMIKIKNVSGRTCVRDVGSDMQEIYIQQGTAKAWSSDSCAKRSGGEMKTFPPNLEVSYEVFWDGKSTAQGCDNRPWMAKGTYQLHGRLGTKISDPVSFTVTG